MILRHEINILDHRCDSATVAADFNEIAQLDTTQYNGTVTYYWEIVALNTYTLSRNVHLNKAGFTGTSGISISVPASTSAFTLFRSAAFTPTAGQTEYHIALTNTVTAAQLQVKSARIIIIQDTSTITNAETQIEIGNYNTGLTAESATILTNPKYWKYDASKWDGTTNFYAEAVYDSGSMDTVSVYLYESADILAPSWSAKATIVSAATTTAPTRTRVAFTPVDGRWYTIFSLNGSMDNHDIYRAGIVVVSSKTVQVGNGLTISGAGNPALAALSSTRVAFIDNSNDSLRTYDFDGSNWSLVGNGLAIAASSPALAALSSTRVAHISASGGGDLRTYDFDGSDWALVGNGLTISTVGNPALAALSSNRVAFFDTTNDSLRTYDFDGSDWALVGSGLAITIAGNPALAALSSTRVALIGNANDPLRTYDFDGSNWALVGNGLTITGANSPALAALSSTRVAFIDSALDSLRTYDFDGTNWAFVGSGLEITGANSPALAALSSTRVAFFDSSNISLRTYDLLQSFTKLEPQYLLANTLFAAGTALQLFLTKWDSTEWSGVTNTYYFQAEAANGSTSDVELWEADGGGSGLGVLTNIDNAQISSAVTMPASQDMDTKATTNAGDVAAARILVTVVVAAVTIPPRNFGYILGT